MYIVIVGAGDIGTPLTRIATEGGNEVVVVERDVERAEQVATDFDCMVINDDATVKETLVDAGGTVRTPSSQPRTGTPPTSWRVS